MFDQAEVIHAYTRAMALADGVLVDATEMAKEAGFKVPVAMTTAVYESCVAWTPEDDASKGGCGQSEDGRMWDVVWLAYQAAKITDGDRAEFSIYRIPREGGCTDPVKTHLVLTIHPGDQGEAVCTIMEPGED